MELVGFGGSWFHKFVAGRKEYLKLSIFVISCLKWPCLRNDGTGYYYYFI